MSDFPLHDSTHAPDESVPLLEQVTKKFGFAPNLTRVLAEAPAALEAYLTLGALLDSTSLDPAERQVVILATSFENGCGYCMSAHTATARMTKVAEPVVEALRTGTPLPDSRLEVLATFVRAVVRERGWVGGEVLDAFLAGGYSRRQALEVLVGVTMKTLSNYTNHMAATPLDEAFKEHAWSAPESGLPTRSAG